jgi:hypothetical protein
MTPQFLEGLKIKTFSYTKYPIKFVIFLEETNIFYFDNVLGLIT